MRKVSLHVGLNYPGTSAELSGCVNDAQDWQEVFAGLGYDPLLLAEPTKAELLTAIQAELYDLRFGDRFVFTYSGHGSWIPDDNGDEPDGRDEVLCPSDFRRNVLTDDELFATMAQARFGVRRTIISDSCFSGTVNRAVRLDAWPVSPPYETKRRFMPPELIAEARVRRDVAVVRNAAGAVLVSGCDDTEYSYDAWFGSRPNGAFTRVAIDSYRPGMKMKEWHAAIRESLPSTSYPQSPQLQAKPWQRHFKL